MTLWTVALQAPLFMRFFRQEYWNGLQFSILEDLPDPGIESVSPALATDSLPVGRQESPKHRLLCAIVKYRSKVRFYSLAGNFDTAHQEAL